MSATQLFIVNTMRAMGLDPEKIIGQVQNIQDHANNFDRRLKNIEDGIAAIQRQLGVSENERSERDRSVNGGGPNPRQLANGRGENLRNADGLS